MTDARSPRHRCTPSYQEELIDQGHLDYTDEASWYAAVKRLAFLHEAERKAMLRLLHEQDDPEVMCHEHRDYDGDHCYWNDPDLLYMALYDVTHPNTSSTRGAHLVSHPRRTKQEFSHIFTWMNETTARQGA